MEEKRFQELFPEPGKETGAESLSFFRHMKQKMQPEQLFKAEEEQPVRRKGRKWKSFVLYSATAAAYLILLVILPNLPGLLESSVGTNDSSLEEGVPEKEDIMVHGDFSGQEDGKEKNEKEENGKEEKDNETENGKDIKGNPKTAAEESGKEEQEQKKEKAEREQKERTEEFQEKENQEEENQEKEIREKSEQEKESVKAAEEENGKDAEESGKNTEEKKDGDKSSVKEDQGKMAENEQEAVPEADSDSDGVEEEVDFDSEDTAVTTENAFDENSSGGAEKNEELQKALTGWYDMEYSQNGTDTAAVCQDMGYDSAAAEDSADADDIGESAEAFPESVSSAGIEEDADSLEVSGEDIFGQLERDLRAFPYLCFYVQGKERWYQRGIAQESGEGKHLLGNAGLFREKSSVLSETNPVQYQAYIYEDETDPSAVYVRLSVQGEDRYYQYTEAG